MSLQLHHGNPIGSQLLTKNPTPSVLSKETGGLELLFLMEVALREGCGGIITSS